MVLDKKEELQVFDNSSKEMLIKDDYQQVSMHNSAELACSIGKYCSKLWLFCCSKAYHVTRLSQFWAYFCLIFLGLSFHIRRRTFVSAESLAYLPTESIFLDCGSSAKQSLSLGRNWSSDIGSQFIASKSDSDSIITTASKGMTVPYITARLFYTKFSYTFNVTPGPNFIHLHFYSDSYQGLNASQSFLTVTAGRYTLLRNFSCYLTAKYLKTDHFFKEYIVYVENHTLELMFSPTSNPPNAYGFVNEIEVVSMPLQLYIPGDDVPLPFVGFHNNMLAIDKKFALEMVYSANVGGQTISPDQDTGMFRTWNDDASCIFGAAFGQLDYDTTVSIQYPKTVPAYTAPEDVYRTTRSMGQYNEINMNYNLSWFFPVDTGFLYLVRLHFCEIVPDMTLGNQRVFFIFINNQTAETQADVIVWRKGHGVAVYRDYIVMVPSQAARKQDLWLELHPNIQVKPEYYDAILNVLEIFKISNYDGNLAGFNPPLDESNIQQASSPALSKKSKKGLQNGIKRKWKMKNTKDSSPCNNFHADDITKATNNFDESLVIYNLDMGKVYKGEINGTAVAILRGVKEISEQDFKEGIKMLSQTHHHNIVSLLGYCQEDSEKILLQEACVESWTAMQHGARSLLLSRPAAIELSSFCLSYKYRFETLFDACCCHCSNKWYHEPESLRGLCMQSVVFESKPTASSKFGKIEAFGFSLAG
ncbi:receptor-like protein kinase FERONIA [Gossypium hirsutum]|uniref:Receptor-like protein kinase FERONIA n=1 Tax=Gossypium hirsutum TaxID=3635 RepID=A0ABM2ZDF4_GOSHI|nr:receptor-like protein kinase FERONIA [Gossypium hirsutum]